MGLHSGGLRSRGYFLPCLGLPIFDLATHCLDWGLHSEGLHFVGLHFRGADFGGLDSRATDFGPGRPLIGLGVYILGVTVWQAPILDLVAQTFVLKNIYIYIYIERERTLQRNFFSVKFQPEDVVNPNNCYAKQLLS